MPAQYKSDALAAVHETATGLADAGVMAKQTIRVGCVPDRLTLGDSPLRLHDEPIAASTE